MVKIFIDPGHGGYDSGAVGNGLYEKNVVLAISKKIKAKLLRYEGVQVKLSREDDRYLSLKQRTDMANAWGADYVLSVHINSNAGTPGTGFESFTYNRNYSGKQETNRKRSIIHTEIMRAMGSGVRDRGMKEANLHMVRECRAQSMLTENLFINNPNDASKLKQDSFLDKIAQGHVNGLVIVFGLKKKPQSKPVNKGEDDMLDKAIVINSFADYPFAESLANKLACPIYTRNVAWNKKVAKELYVVGGGKTDLKADRFIVLSGSNRFETAERVRQHIAKL